MVAREFTLNFIIPEKITSHYLYDKWCRDSYLIPILIHQINILVAFFGFHLT